MSVGEWFVTLHDIDVVITKVLIIPLLTGDRM